MRIKVEEALNSIRPMLQEDGGDIDLIDVNDDGVVTVRLTGVCGCCSMSKFTLKSGVEERLKEMVPEVTKVVIG